MAIRWFHRYDQCSFSSLHYYVCFRSAFNSGSSLGSNFSSGTGGLATNFNTPYNNSLGNSTFGTGTFGNTSAFGTGNTSAFGTGNTSAFGTGNTSAFGASNTSAFGTGSATGGFGSASGFGTGTAFASPGSTDQQGSLFSSPFGQSNKMFSKFTKCSVSSLNVQNVQ